MSQEESDLEVIAIDIVSEPSSSKSNIQSQSSGARLSLQGTFKRHQVKVNTDVLIEKKSLQPWIKAKVSSLPRDSIMTYRVKLLPKKFNNQMKDVFGKQLAVFIPATAKIPVATRVAALYKESKNSNYWSGIVAECPKSTNGQRYLIFYDDGSTQYVNHDDVFVVCESSSDVWDDVPDGNKLFIKNYLSKYPEIPMTKLAPNQELKTEWNCKWWKTKVLSVDASLVQLYFEADKRTEWIYRGSLRLEPLYLESLKNPAMFQPTCNKNKENVSTTLPKKEAKSSDNLNTPLLPSSLPNTISSHGLVATKKVTQIRTSTRVKNQESVVGLPPVGPLIKTPAEIGANVLVKIHQFMPWAQAKVLEIKSRIPLEYLIKYKSAKFNNQTKTVPAKDLAVHQVAMIIIPVNTRVVAIFEDTQTSKYYSGVVGECPNINNDWRYLVFFDDGYCQYVYHDKVCFVNESSPRVWEDVPVELRDFIKKYHDSYPKRTMIKLTKNQTVQTEWNGKWYDTEVVDVDASLAQIKFNNEDRTEWIYRGSMRLKPIYKSEMEHEQRKQEEPVVKKSKVSEPIIKTEPKERDFTKQSRTPKPKAIPITKFVSIHKTILVAKKSTTKN